MSVFSDLPSTYSLKMSASDERDNGRERSEGLIC